MIKSISKYLKSINVEFSIDGDMIELHLGSTELFIQYDGMDEVEKHYFQMFSNNLNLYSSFEVIDGSCLDVVYEEINSGIEEYRRLDRIIRRANKLIEEIKDLFEDNELELDNFYKIE